MSATVIAAAAALAAVRALLHTARRRSAARRHPTPAGALTAEQLLIRMHSAENMPDAVARHNSAVVEAERIIAAAVKDLPADQRRFLDRPA